MPVLAITGGVATGKSSFARCIQRLINARLFDADATARALLENDALVKDRVWATFGPQVSDKEGRIRREQLRELVFQDPAKRKALEAILHPLIRAQWEAEANEARQKPEWLLIDIPLLYETGGETHADQVVVVACTRQTQLRRMQDERGLTRPMAEAIINAQAPLAEKMKRASFIIWTDSFKPFLDEQARLLAAYLNYG